VEQVQKSQLDIDHVIAILDAGKVVTYEQACEAFGRDKNDFPVIRYTEETLRECATQNHSGQADWRFVYVHSLSLREQRKFIGTNLQNQPCFHNDSMFFGGDWWVGPDWYDPENKWATSQPEAGYYLIDMQGRFNSTNWHDQDVLISKMGDVYERADERVLSQALISIFKIYGERLHTGTYHWGWMEDSGGFRVWVGYFVADGLHIGHMHPDDVSEHLFVCVVRKFQA
jgi:hypothetical protein